MKCEYLSTRLGDGTEVVDYIRLGHADTGITDRQGLVLLVGDDADDEVLVAVDHRWVGERLVANFVEGIGGVRDDLTKEDLLVGVEDFCTLC